MGRTAKLMTIVLTLGAWTTTGVSGQSAGNAGGTVDAEALAFVDAWIEALGGMEGYWNLNTARYPFTTEMYEAESGRLRRARPRYVTIAHNEAGELARIERWEGDNFIQQGFDGTTDWARMNGEPLPEGEMDKDQVRYVSGDVNYWISLPFKLRDPGVNLGYEGKDREGRHDIIVTFGEDVGSDIWHYYFVEGQTWPVEVTYDSGGRGRPARTLWKDLHTVDGYTYVGRRVHIDREGRMWKVLRMSDVEINPDIDMAVFRRP